MHNIKFLKTLTAGVALAMAIYPQAWAACPSGYSRDSSSGLCVNSTACGGNCTYYYNDTTFDFEAKVNPNVAAGTPVLMDGEFKSTMHNATIGEGITGFSKIYVFFYNPTDSQQGRGTLTLPSTFNDTSGDGRGLWTNAFATYDLSAMKNANLSIGLSSNYDIIVKDDANLNIYKHCDNGYCPPTVNIQCRGEQSECRKQLKNGSGHDNWTDRTTINTSYYVGDDGNGNWEVWSDDGVAIYDDSTKQKLLSKYDMDGNQTGIYKYDGAGNLTAAYENGVSTYKRTSYTPAEAAAAVKKGNKNKVTLIFK